MAPKVSSTSSIPAIPDPIHSSPLLLRGIPNPGCNCWLNCVLQLFVHLPLFQRMGKNSELAAQLAPLFQFSKDYHANLPLETTSLRRWIHRELLPSISPLNDQEEDPADLLLEIFARAKEIPSIHQVTETLDSSGKVIDASASTFAGSAPIPIPLPDSVLRAPPFSQLIDSYFIDKVEGNLSKDQLIRRSLQSAPSYLSLQVMRFHYKKTVLPVSEQTGTWKTTCKTYLFFFLRGLFILCAIAAGSFAALLCLGKGRGWMPYLIGSGVVASLAIRLLSPKEASIRAANWVIEQIKVKRPVDIPLHFTLLPHQCPSEPAGYECSAFICHLGRSSGSGHYVVYMRQGTQWMRFNDGATPIPISEQEVKNQIRFSYLLIFEKSN